MVSSKTDIIIRILS